MALSHETIIEWRKFSTTPAYRDGIDHLRRERALNVKGKSAVEVLEEAGKWGAYQEALDDITNILTYIGKPEKSLEEPPLGN